MDEVDGRPGPVARKFGHLDASHGVPPLSLSLPSTPCHPEQVYLRRQVTSRDEPAPDLPQKIPVSHPFACPGSPRIGLHPWGGYWRKGGIPRHSISPFIRSEVRCGGRSRRICGCFSRTCRPRETNSYSF